jgi:TonB family protein
MIDWLIEQTLLITLILSLLLLGGSKLTKVIGASSHYALWMIIPISLVINTINFSFWVDKSSVATFLISAKEKANEMTQVELETSWAFIALWLAGAFTILGYSLFLHFKSLAQSNSYQDTIAEQSIWDNKLVSTKVKIRFTPDNISPYLFGIVSPTLIVPTNFQQVFSTEQQKLILAHELVHFSRKDILWNHIGMALITVFWFNPLCWLAYRRFRILQELSCDQRVLEGRNKQTRLQYAKALLNASSQDPIFNLSQLTFGEKSMLKERLYQLKINKPSSFVSKSIVAMCMLLSGSILTLANADSQKQSEEIRPIERVNPKYPLAAAEKGIEGFVRMAFDIDKQGRVDNIHVLKSLPEGVFDDSATRALEQWIYTNPTGETITASVQLDFAMSEPEEKISVVAN